MVATATSGSPALRRVAGQVAVLGVGEPGHGDLDVGVVVVEALRDRLPPDVRAVTIERIDARSASELDGVTHLLLVDVVDVGRSPGAMVLFDAEMLTPCVAMASFRDLDLAHLLVLAGQGADAPEQVALLGVQPGARQDGLSPEVEAIVPAMIDEAMHVLLGWLEDPSARSGSSIRAETPPC